MKKIILATIPAITLGVAIAPEVNAEEKNYLTQRHQTQAISQMKEQLVH